MPARKKVIEQKIAKKTKSKDKTKNLSKEGAIRKGNLNFRAVFLNLSNIVNKNKTYIFYLIPLLILVAFIYLGFKWLVVAWVDKTPITKIALYQELEQKYGEDLREQKIVENLVKNEASKRAVVVSREEVDQEAKKIEDQVGGKETLDSLLLQQKVSFDEFKGQVELQLLIRKMFEKDVSVSEDEIKKYFEENKESLLSSLDNPDISLEDESSSSSQLKEDIKNQLQQQKINQSFKTWLQENQNSARVIRL